MILGWAFTIFAFLASILILTRKGNFLIEGFYTPIKKNKDKYNLNRLRHVTGSGIGIISIILGLYFYFDELPTVITWINPWGIWAVMVVMLILINTICRVKSTKE